MSGNSTELSDLPRTEAANAPVLITEQQVLFGSAASIAGAPAQAPRPNNPLQVFTTAVRSLISNRTPLLRQGKAHYAPRDRSYYNGSLSSRARGRL